MEINEVIETFKEIEERSLYLWKDTAEDVLNILKNSKTKEEAIKKLKERYKKYKDLSSSSYYQLAIRQLRRKK